ncbi:Rhomboid-related protein 4 [Amphibalanus amphitrite]|uniref:Rhomboid-related protein 4 n=1 Tax=Amphibalanus amphitrite TaxID=1232801 RepID=A0A6A4VWL8_AMPAM|nr:Rhomboid-related protein 4 [Amphibalanus amphitrite]
MQPRRGRGQSQVGLGVIMLASQLLNVGLDRIPPVTLATIAAQVALFLNIIRPPWHRYDACISVLTVLRQGDYKRILISTFEHADEWHLYYNMVSFLWKGMRLEQRMGSRRFAILLAVFSVSCSITYLALAKTATDFFHDGSYSRQCAIGFSGVIFALKVLTHQLESAPGTWTYLSGLAVPARWAVWAELVLIHILVPGASFIGHLAGILVGLAYTYGPLEYAVSCLDKIIAVPLARAGSTHARGASYTYHSGSTGRRSGGGGGGSWSAGGPRSGGPGSGGFWGAAPEYGGGYPPRPSAPPDYGWSVPPHDGPAGADDGDEDAALAEAIRRSRQTYSEESAARRRFEPSAPPL